MGKITRLKSEMYKGKKVTFEKYDNNGSISVVSYVDNNYVSNKKTKELAFIDAKKVIDLRKTSLRNRVENYVDSYYSRNGTNFAYNMAVNDLARNKAMKGKFVEMSGSHQILLSMNGKLYYNGDSKRFSSKKEVIDFILKYVDKNRLVN